MKKKIKNKQKNEQDNVYNSSNIITEQSNNIVKSLDEVEEALIKSTGTDTEKLSTYIYLLCDSNMEHYKRTIDLIDTIDRFKKKLDK